MGVGRLDNTCCRYGSNNGKVVEKAYQKLKKQRNDATIILIMRKNSKYVEVSIEQDVKGFYFERLCE